MEEKMEFKHTIKFTNDLFSEAIMQKPRYEKKSKIPFLKYVILLPIIILLFNRYTLSLGIGLIFFYLIFKILNKNEKKIIGYGFNSTFDQSKYLHHEITYKLDDEYLYIESEKFYEKSSWDLITVWYIKKDWLQIGINGMAPILFPLVPLKKEGIFTTVEEKLKGIAKEYNT